MVVLSGRQGVAAGELAEWREDVAGGIGSRLVLLAVPAVGRRVDERSVRRQHPPDCGRRVGPAKLKDQIVAAGPAGWSPFLCSR
jgi:hypothetical protein